VKKNMGRMKISSRSTKCSRRRTIITGINPHPEEALKKFRKAFGSGGYIEGKMIVLQGDHRQKLGDIAVRLGFSKRQIQKMFNFSPPFFVFNYNV
jgi:translation initiation factor 1 (eIF-1/SUI1)